MTPSLILFFCCCLFGHFISPLPVEPGSPCHAKATYSRRRSHSVPAYECHEVFKFSYCHWVRDGNLHGSGRSHATTVSPKPSFRAPWRCGRRRGRQRKCWMDNVKEWTSLPMPELLTMAFCRKDWKRFSAESSVVSPTPR